MSIDRIKMEQYIEKYSVKDTTFSFSTSIALLLILILCGLTSVVFLDMVNLPLKVLFSFLSIVFLYLLYLSYIIKKNGKTAMSISILQCIIFTYLPIFFLMMISGFINIKNNDYGWHLSLLLLGGISTFGFSYLFMYINTKFRKIKEKPKWSNAVIPVSMLIGTIIGKLLTTIFKYNNEVQLFIVIFICYFLISFSAIIVLKLYFVLKIEKMNNSKST